jgi:hypothetical protein
VHAVAEDDHPRHRRDFWPAALRFELESILFNGFGQNSQRVKYKFTRAFQFFQIQDTQLRIF